MSASHPRVVSLRRAAHNLARQGKVRLYYSRDREHRLVVARPSIDLDTLRRCLPRMSRRRRTEVDLRVYDEQRAAEKTDCYNSMEPYRQWLDENGRGDSQEALEEWMDELHYGEWESAGW